MNEFNFDTPKPNEKITSIWYCRHGKFRITEEEERQLFSQRGDKSKHPMLRLLEIRKEKKRARFAT